jgi:hypothetical protein
MPVTSPPHAMAQNAFLAYPLTLMPVVSRLPPRTACDLQLFCQLFYIHAHMFGIQRKKQKLPPYCSPAKIMASVRLLPRCLAQNSCRAFGSPVFFAARGGKLARKCYPGFNRKTAGINSAAWPAFKFLILKRFL